MTIPAHDTDGQQRKWDGLFRGSVLNAAITKHVSYLTSADTRAQGLILLNAALVPLALSGMEAPELRSAAVLCALTALLTITLCIFCLYPKRFSGQNILHYVEFGKLTEDEFAARMRVLFADKEQLADAAVRDLYHLGTKILAPKYLFLRLAYMVFLLGQLTAALLALAGGR